VARDNEFARDGLFGSAFHQGALGGVLSSAVLLALWAVLSLGVIVQVMLPLSVVVGVSPGVDRAGHPDQAMAGPPRPSVSHRVDSGPGRRTGSSGWVVTTALAGVGGKLLADDPPLAHLDEESLDAQPGCVPCKLCPLSGALDPSTGGGRGLTETARPRP
jgi:hypothetical protein